MNKRVFCHSVIGIEQKRTEKNRPELKRTEYDKKKG